MTDTDQSEKRLLLNPDHAYGEPLAIVTGDYANRVPTETLGLSSGLTTDVNSWVQEYQDIKAEVYPDHGVALGPLRDSYEHSARGDELIQRIRDELGPAWRVERTEGRLFRPSPPPRGESGPTYYLDPDHPEVA